MGDLKRGRTVRSLSYLMENYRDVHLVFIAPPAFEMEADIKQHLIKGSEMERPGHARIPAIS